jgi:uncharacterized protein YgfB (UPF0149 family)
MSNFEDISSELYENLEEVLADDDCDISAAELQGAVAGMLSCGLKSGDPHWRFNLLSTVNDGVAFSAKVDEVFDKIANESDLALAEQDSLAPILLPGDDYPVIDQIEALSKWCQGFLLGFGLQSGQSNIKNAEVAEAISDISEISQLEVDADDGEESQTALITLIEHLRVAVKVIYLELVTKQSLTANKKSGKDVTYH